MQVRGDDTGNGVVVVVGVGLRRGHPRKETGSGANMRPLLKSGRTPLKVMGLPLMGKVQLRDLLTVRAYVLKRILEGKRTHLPMRAPGRGL